MLARIAALACAAVLANHADAFAQNEALLNGRYSFRMDGTSANGHTSRLGSLKFDGNGQVTAASIKETTGSESRTFGGSSDDRFFMMGSYSVDENNRGGVSLTFCELVIDFDLGGSFCAGWRNEYWDIALTNGGAELSLNVADADFGGPFNLGEDPKLTLNGEARPVAGTVPTPNEGLLNGRYSFTADGKSHGEAISRVGTLKFDGHGNITAPTISGASRCISALVLAMATPTRARTTRSGILRCRKAATNSS